MKEIWWAKAYIALEHSKYISRAFDIGVCWKVRNMFDIITNEWCSIEMRSEEIISSKARKHSRNIYSETGINEWEVCKQSKSSNSWCEVMPREVICIEWVRTIVVRAWIAKCNSPIFFILESKYTIERDIIGDDKVLCEERDSSKRVDDAEGWFSI